jgi:sulfatase maturation enzyme AslB (radical SAM superfamily)
MNYKKYVTDPTFCPVPWTGFMYNFDGSVKNCIRSAEKLGNIADTPIRELLKRNSLTRQCMRDGIQTTTCEPCYTLEAGKRDLNIISDRKFYVKALKDVPLTLYTEANAFQLNTVDIRWSNLCNFACVYCGPEFSSKIAAELKIKIETPPAERVADMKNFVFENAANLKHVYMAGGEPLLMKENEELLLYLKQVNPKVQLRVNTNLSKVDTKIFDLICGFEDVHWTISAETIENEYEYIRWGSRWQDFLDNLMVIKDLTHHKINFNMLHLALNPMSLFTAVDYFKGIGFTDHSFIAGALLGPSYYDIRNLPDSILLDVEQELVKRLDDKPVSFWRDSMVNLLRYIKQPMDKKIDETLWHLSENDLRRGCNFRVTFKDLIERIEKEK